MNRKELMAVIKELNQDEKLLAKIDEKKIIVVGVKTDILIEDFKQIMIKLDDAGLTDDVPENCIDFFEENLDEFMLKKESGKIKEKIEKVIENSEEKAEEKSVGNEKDGLGDESGNKSEQESAEKNQGKAKTGNGKEEIGKKGKYHKEYAFLAELVGAGKYTSKEIIKKAIEEFPGAQKKLFSDKLSYGKNPKYNKFDSLILMDDGGVLHFE